MPAAFLEAAFLATGLAAAAAAAADIVEELGLSKVLLVERVLVKVDKTKVLMMLTSVGIRWWK